MLSPTINSDVLDFGGYLGFEMVVVIYLFLYQGGRFSLFIIWLISFIFEDVTPVLVKCVVSSGSVSITLSIYISFTLLFCFANFVNWRSLSGWMGFEVVDVQVSQPTSLFQKSCPLSDFHMDCYYCIHRSFV